MESNQVTQLDPYLSRAIPIEVGIDTSDVLSPYTVTNVKTGGLASNVRFTTAGTLVTTSDDWETFGSGVFTYSSATRINVAGIDTLRNFAIGDRLKVTQSTIKYLLVSNVSSGYIDVTRSDDYGLTNEAIVSIAKSSLPAPSGHPLFLDIYPTIYKGSDESAFSGAELPDTRSYAGVSMVGNIVFLTLYLDWSAVFESSEFFPGGESSIYVATPLPNVGTITYGYVISEGIHTSTGGTSVKITLGNGDITGYDGVHAKIETLDEGTFSAGPQEFLFSCVFTRVAA